MESKKRKGSGGERNKAELGRKDQEGGRMKHKLSGDTALIKHTVWLRHFKIYHIKYLQLVTDLKHIRFSIHPSIIYLIP